MAKENETIEVLYAMIDKNGTYSKLAGTSICSMLENTREKVHIYLFHDGSITGTNKDNFEELVRRYGQEITFYNVRELLADVWEKAEKIRQEAITDARFTEATLYRLLAPQILENVGRLIYLDADTLVNIDIRELWQEKIGSNGMAAVMENDLLARYGMRGVGLGEELQKLLDYWQTLGVKVDNCFNAGILLMDLDKIRPMGNLLLSGLRVAVNCEAKNNFYDQNILNFYFAKDAAHLPWKYNILQHWDRTYKKSHTVRGIYHYMGHTLKMDENDMRDTLYYDYFIKTPWADGKFLCRFYHRLESVHLVNVGRKIIAGRRLIVNLAQKKLVLAATEEKKGAIAKLLGNPTEFNFRIEEAANVNPSGKAYEQILKKQEKANKEYLKKFPIPEKIRFFSLGSEKKMNLNLPYDIDSYFYLFFVEDYVPLKICLEQAGLEETGHYMDGSIFIDETPGLGGIINITKMFEKL